MTTSHHARSKTTLKLVSNSQERTLFRHELEIPSQAKRPLSIHINASTVEALKTSHPDAIQYLLAELSLWRQVLGNRKIANLELEHSCASLELHEPTILIHHIVNTFTVPSPCYRVVLNPESAHPTLFALLKGLGFCCCQFSIDQAHDASLDVLEKAFANARLYQFSYIGIQVKHSGEMHALSEWIKQVKTKLNPSYIFFGSSTAILTPKEFEQPSTLFEDDLAYIDIDKLSIGPGSSSEFGGHKYASISNTRRYIELVEQKTLPIHRS